MEKQDCHTFPPASQDMYSRQSKKNIRTIKLHQVSFFEPKPCFVSLRDSIREPFVIRYQCGSFASTYSLEYCLPTFLQKIKQLCH